MLALNHSENTVTTSNVSATLSDTGLFDYLLFMLFGIVFDVCGDSILNKFVVRLVMPIRLHCFLHLHFLIEIKVAVN